MNLLERFGRAYQVTYDPAAGKPDPWLAQVPCRYGVVYPHGGEVLAVEVDGHGKVAARLGHELGLKIHQGDDGKDVHDRTKDWGGEVTFLFPVSRFKEVAAVVKPRRRRAVTEAEKGRRAGLVEAGKRSR